MEGQAAHHLGRVLRAQTGQLYELSDGEQVWVGRIESVGRDRVQFALVEELPVVQPRVEVTLLLSVVKFDAFEWAIEKATELAVSTIVPCHMTRMANSPRVSSLSLIRSYMTRLRRVASDPSDPPRRAVDRAGYR